MEKSRHDEGKEDNTIEEQTKLLFNDAKLVLENDLCQNNLSDIELVHLRKMTREFIVRRQQISESQYKEQYYHPFNYEWDIVIQWLNALYGIDLNSLPDGLFDYRSPYSEYSVTDPKSQKITIFPYDIVTGSSGYNEMRKTAKKIRETGQRPEINASFDGRLAEYIRRVRDRAHLM